MTQAVSPVPAELREMFRDGFKPAGSGEESPTPTATRVMATHGPGHEMRPGKLVRRAGSANMRFAINGRGAPTSLYVQNGTPIDVLLPMQIQG